MQPVRTLAWTRDGKTLGLGLAVGALASWDPKGALRWAIPANISGIKDFCFSPNGQAIASRSHYEVRLWNRDGSQPSAPFH